MIRGYFAAAALRPRPFISALVEIPAASNGELAVTFLIDTGADRTLLAPLDAARLGLDLDHLAKGIPSTGVGGRMEARATPARLTMDSVSIDLELTLLAPSPALRQLPIPSLLGRDVLHRFCLVLDEGTDRVLLLTPGELDQLNLP